MKTLLMPIGLARSGKSTWAKNQGLPIISADAVRLALHGERYNSSREQEVWVLMSLIVEALFLAGNDVVILDATSLNEASRNKWRVNDYVLKFKLFDTSPEVCKERAIITEQEDLLPVIDEMVEKINYNEIELWDLWDIGDDGKYLMIMKERDEINQKNSHIHKE